MPVPATTGGAVDLWLAAALGPPPPRGRGPSRTCCGRARSPYSGGRRPGGWCWNGTPGCAPASSATCWRAGSAPGTGRGGSASEIGWRLDGWHVAFHIAALGRVDLLRHTDAVAAALAAERVEATLVERGDGWSGWTTARAEPDQDAGRDLLAALRKVRRRLAGRFDCAIGVGRAHPDAPGLTRSLAEAWDASRLARDGPQTGRLVHIDRLGLAQLLTAWASSETFAPAAARLLEPLESQPGDLIATLAAYLDAGGSAADTAAVLGVHRNTVAARLRRVEELLTVDLDQPRRPARPAPRLPGRRRGPGRRGLIRSGLLGYGGPDGHGEIDREIGRGRSSSIIPRGRNVVNRAGRRTGSK